ncbi:MAG: S9 family peptidase, partial [Clostridia bacterium]|nr:S9 family peptidase [Clostridia bacterium]
MKRITPETFLDYNFLSAPCLSPDGGRTAFVVKQADVKTNGYRSDLWLVCNKTGKTRRLTAQGDAGPFVWTREGKLLFSAPRGEKHAAAQALCAPSTTYFEIDPDGGEAVPAFTLPVAGGAPRFLQNGKAAVVGRVDLNRPAFESMDEDARKRAVEQYQKPGFHIIEEIPFWENGGTFSSRMRNALFLCDTAAETAQVLTEPYFTVDGVDVSGDRIVYSGVSYTDRLPEQGGLYLYENGETRALLPEGAYSVGAFRFLDGDTVIAALTPKGAHTYAMPDLYRVDLKDGALTKIADWDGSVGGASVASDARLGGGFGMKADGGKAYFVSTREDEGVLFSVDRAGKVEEVNQNAGSIDSFDVQNGEFVLCAMRGDRMAELYAFENGAERRLTGLNDAFYEQYSVVTPEPTRFTATDGFEIHGWVMPPVGYVKGEKHPCIFHIHGGPATVFGSVFHNEMQMWANAGYFVIFCNPRGGDGRGLEFVDLYHKYGTVDYDNLMEFVDHCLARYPDIDETRLGVTGGSYGGF